MAPLSPLCQEPGILTNTLASSGPCQGRDAQPREPGRYTLKFLAQVGKVEIERSGYDTYAGGDCTVLQSRSASCWSSTRVLSIDTQFPAFLPVLVAQVRDT